MLIPKQILAIADFCDEKEGSRYALQAVSIERNANGQPVACATDGRYLVAVEWPEADASDYPGAIGGPEKTLADSIQGKDSSFSVLVNATDIKELKSAHDDLKKKPAKGKPVLNNVYLQEEPAPWQQGQVVMSCTNSQVTTTLSPPKNTGKFPKWRDIIPTHPDGRRGEHIRINAKRLAAILEFIGELVDDENHEVTLTLSEGNDYWEKPLVVSAEHKGIKAVGVLMPVYIQDTTRAPKPLWLAEKDDYDHLADAIQGKIP